LIAVVAVRPLANLLIVRLLAPFCLLAAFSPHFGVKHAKHHTEI